MLDFITIKNFYSVEDNVKRMRTPATHSEKIFRKIYMVKDYYLKYIKNS